VRRKLHAQQVPEVEKVYRRFFQWNIDFQIRSQLYVDKTYMAVVNKSKQQRTG